MSAPAVEMRGVTKDFPAGLRGLKVRAVDGLSLTVPANCVYGLLGPNGSGKSTSIKMLLGLVRPSAGECRVFGAPGERPGTRRQVGFLPESPFFPRHLTGRELVRFHGRLCGLRGPHLESRTDEVIGLAGLAGAAGRRLGTYSKGMLQRIGLAQALVHDPPLVVLDEPTAGVDPVGAEAIAAIVRALKDQGKTVLLCSHLLSQVERVCDRVAILHRGALVREGGLGDLLAEAGAESYVVEGLGEGGRARMEAAIAEAGGKLKRVEHPRRGLDALFMEAVGTDRAADSGKEPGP